MEKMKEYLCVILLASLAGCTFFENDLPGGKPRLSNKRSGNGPDSVNIIKSPDDPELPGVTCDTTVFVSAVRCGPGYDWQRDTAYGCVDARLLLYRNGKEELSIPAGGGTSVSVSPDMHHIVDGHLYTEYCDYSRTVIGRDGQTLYSVEGRELLKGLLAIGDDLYALSENVSSGALIFRRNGERLVTSAKATAFGGFDDPSYGRNGALYEDSGAVCYAFRTSDGCCHMVRDGLMTTVAEKDAFDVKSVGGRNISAGTLTLGHRWKDARIWRTGGFYAVSGEGADGIFRFVSAEDFSVVQFPYGNPVIYCSDGMEKALDRDEMERISFCFSPRCATLAGFSLISVCTPRDGSLPYLLCGEKKMFFEGLEGYLTGVDVAVSPSSKLLLSLP